MKIATYNIWDSDAGMPFRFRQLVDEIARTGADILCLQEVSHWETHHRLSALCGYDHSHWQARTGLSILSRHPIAETADLEHGAFARIRVGGRTLLVVNLHLPWERASLREKAIVHTVERIADIKADYTLLTGDFNSSEDSSVHRFLTGEQSLLGADACFFDLAEAYAEMNGTKAPATLNFRENPRWGTAGPKNTMEINQRFDWTLLKNPYPSELPELKNCTLFGTEIAAETHLSASDHYGVMTEIEFQDAGG